MNRPRESDASLWPRLRALIAVLAVLVSLTVVAAARAQHSARPLLLHVKTALSVDDAQICVVPNVAWAALEEGRPVTIVFDGSAVTSVVKGWGWRGWFGAESTAMDRAALPERERKSLTEQLDVELAEVPQNYAEFLHLLKERGAVMYYNRTMALLYNIDPESLDSVLKPLGLKELLKVLHTDGDYLVY